MDEPEDSPQQGGAGQSGGVNIDAGKVQPDGDIVGRDKVTNIYEAAQAWKAPRQIPAPPADFTGRVAEIATLAAQVKQGGGLIAEVHGMGGIGKSALALAVAAQVGDAFPDGQIFVEMRGTETPPLAPGAVMAHVIRAWHPAARLPEEEATLAGLYRSTLHGQRVLLLLDNAAGAEQVRPLLPPAGCGLLVTSRVRFALPGLLALTLETLPRPEAISLLQTIAPHLTGAEADRLADRCGDLPLALTLAGGALVTYLDLTPTEYLRRLDDARERLSLVEASLSLSYELLDEAQQERWRALATFPGSFARAAAASLWDEDEGSAAPALSALLAQSLVQWAPPAQGEEQGRYRLHDLARLFATSRLTDDERMVYAHRHATHYRALLTRTKELCKAGNPLDGLRLFDLERENIEAGQCWAAQHAATRHDAAVLCSEYPNAGVYILELRQPPREQIRWREAALSAARLLRHRGMEGSHLGNLGIAYYSLGAARKAIDFHQQQLVIAREIGNRRSEGNALGSLGLAYADLGEVRKAIDYHEQALVISREIGDRRGEGNALGNLGIAYRNLGEVRKAIDYHEQRLLIAREIGDRRGEGNALGNLGIAYRNLGEVRRAIEFYEQGLGVLREIGDRRGEGSALGNLGNAYADLGEVRKAITYHEQYLAIVQEIGDRRGEGNALGSLGVAYQNLGEVRKAIDFYQQHLTITQEIGDRRGESIALWNLALALDNLGERAEAIRHAQASLVIREQIEDPRAEKVRAALAQWQAEGEKGREGDEPEEEQ